MREAVFDGDPLALPGAARAGVGGGGGGGGAVGGRGGGAGGARGEGGKRLWLESRGLAGGNGYRLSGRTGGDPGAQIDCEIALVEITVVGGDAAGQGRHLSG